MAKFEFDVKVPPATSDPLVVKVRCGKSSLVIKQVTKNWKPRLCGGGEGDWLPEFDWRKQYVEKARDRRDYALPYRQMLDIAKKEVRRREASRLLGEATEEVRAQMEQV